MDSIADLLIRITNAQKVKKESVDLPHSRVKEAIARIMMTEGFIGKVDTFARLNKKYLRIVLKYTADKKFLIEGAKRVSTPGRRVYVGAGKVPRVRSGFGLAIISTSKGIMTDNEAREKKIGGEVVCYIW
ncbi:MAG: 30S ribosomal protein S8 [Candidatus Margulisbacteria bacterium]|nr:30S ribosomal protein S8 [Candidatus Margulisiibacteriota bacterium]